MQDRLIQGITYLAQPNGSFEKLLSRAAKTDKLRAHEIKKTPYENFCRNFY
jgi:hypothetical protein